MMSRIMMLACFLVSTLAHSATTPTSASLDGLNQFAFDLYHQTESTSNRVISPFSVSALLTYLTAGAAGQTQSQLLNALHESDPTSAIKMLGDYQKQIALSANAASPLLMANAIWIEKSFPCNPQFLNLLQTNGAAIESVDFIHQPVPTLNKINQWVSDLTKKHIENLLQPDTITANTRIVLTNAIYFQADWQKPFEHNKTYNQVFHAADNTSPQVPMMHNQTFYVYAEDASFQYLEMAYQNTSLTMGIVLPKTASAISSFNNQTFNQLRQTAKMQELNLSLPKFKMNSTYDLIHPLQGIGITNAFDANKADFAPILQNPATQGGLYISAAVQKAMIDVDEKGTVAAAATAVVMEFKSAIVAPHPVLKFTADKPFVFVLYDKNSGMILFMGKVLNPLN